MPASRTEITEITEIVTALGTLAPDLDAALARPPRQLVNVEPAVWERVIEAHATGSEAASFTTAFANGQAFFAAHDGLRGRRPFMVEWKGPHRPPGDDVIPADLRIDRVYLISCKYLSKVLVNPGPPRHLDDNRRVLLYPDQMGPVRRFSGPRKGDVVRCRKAMVIAALAVTLSGCGRGKTSTATSVVSPPVSASVAGPASTASATTASAITAAPAAVTTPAEPLETLILREFPKSAKNADCVRTAIAGLDAEVEKNVRLYAVTGEPHGAGDQRAVAVIRAVVNCS